MDDRIELSTLEQPNRSAGATTSATWRLARLRHLPSLPSTSLTAISVRPATRSGPRPTFEPINPAPPVTRSIRYLPLIGFRHHLPHSAGTCNLGSEASDDKV